MAMLATTRATPKRRDRTMVHRLAVVATMVALYLCHQMVLSGAPTPPDQTATIAVSHSMPQSQPHGSCLDTASPSWTQSGARKNLLRRKQAFSRFTAMEETLSSWTRGLWPTVLQWPGPAVPSRDGGPQAETGQICSISPSCRRGCVRLCSKGAGPVRSGTSFARRGQQVSVSMCAGFLHCHATGSSAREGCSSWSSRDASHATQSYQGAPGVGSAPDLGAKAPKDLSVDCRFATGARVCFAVAVLASRRWGYQNLWTRTRPSLQRFGEKRFAPDITCQNPTCGPTSKTWKFSGWSTTEDSLPHRTGGKKAVAIWFLGTKILNSMAHALNGNQLRARESASTRSQSGTNVGQLWCAGVSSRCTSLVARGWVWARPPPDSPISRTRSRIAWRVGSLSPHPSKCFGSEGEGE